MDKITVVIPTSPIRSHPSTDIIDQCIKDIRMQLPNSEIIIMIDGVREEQDYLKDQYNEYTSKVMWKCLHEWNNVMPMHFSSHMHQSGMMLKTIDEIKTPLLLYVEHDTPLVPDRKIDWQKCIKFIEDGQANTIRFHFENVIPEAHKDLILNKQDDFVKTIQWSQRPHLSSVVYYRDQVMSHFPKTARTMIEDKYHGVVMNDFYADGIHGWNKHKLWIYHPKNGIQRSYNLDGRGDEPKYEMKFE